MNVPGIVLHPAAASQLDAFVAAPPHAILFSGPAGSGKTHMADALGAELLGVPVSTLENQAYYRVLAPLKNSISIEQIRELTGFFRLKVPGKRAVKRVAVIRDADTMGHEAQNALLKLLEEPPEGSVLILTSSRPQGLLPTIRSRVQHEHVPKPERKAALEHFLREGYPEEAVASMLLRTDTDMAETERLLAAGARAPDTSVDLVKQALRGTAYDRMLLVDSLSKQKDSLSGFVDTLATVAAASLEAAAKKGTGGVSRWTSILQAAHTAQDALERSGNAKLVLTELMLAI
jgi:DNA polymerase III delta prime subunit